MKQVTILVLCSLIHLSVSQVELDKADDYCTIDHGANIANLEEIFNQLTGLITSLKKEISCRKKEVQIALSQLGGLLGACSRPNKLDSLRCILGQFDTIIECVKIL